MNKEFLDLNPIEKRSDSDVNVLETGPDMYIEEINYNETLDNIERKVLSTKQKIDSIENALISLRDVYVEAGPDQKPLIRDMATSADWALHRAEQELAEVLEALGVTDSD